MLKGNINSENLKGIFQNKNKNKGDNRPSQGRIVVLGD